MENESRHPPASSFHPRRILVRGVNWLGDAVMATPALRRLREKFPTAHIALLGPEKLRGLWLHHPAVNETLAFAPGEGVFAIGKKMRAGKFDLALVLPNSPRSALEVFAAGIPQRVGCARPWRNWFLTQTVPSRAGAVKMHKRSAEEIKLLIAGNSKLRTQNSKFPASAHQINEYLHLAAALGANPEPLAPQLVVMPEEIAAARKKFGLEQITGPIFGLNPGAEYGPAKRWPVEKFIIAAKEIQHRTNCVWILFGGKNDQPLTAQIESALRTPRSAIYNLSGQTSLRELMALLKLCRVLLTNDTGPMHVAAALGTPVVVPFGSTSPELTGPGLPGDARHRLLKSTAPCAPCFLRECPIDFRCMNGLSVELVVAAVLAASATIQGQGDHS
jgi:heptosyltransferase-2